MAEGTIKCPHCGCESLVVPQDLNGYDLVYTCSNCHRDFTVAFFDHCPKCHKNVGFLDSYGFKNDMKNLAQDAINYVATGSWSIFGKLGKAVIDSKANNSKNATGDGECPFCHDRFIRCCSCNELISIDKKADWKNIFRCKCGTAISPNGTTDTFAHRHSRSFYSYGSTMPSQPISLNCMPLYKNKNDRKREKKQDNKNIESTQVCTEKIYTRAELLIIIATCENKVGVAKENSFIVSNRNLLRKQLEIKFDIHISSSQLKTINTYKELIDYIISHTEAPKQKEHTAKDLSPEMNNPSLRAAILEVTAKSNGINGKIRETEEVNADHRLWSSLSMNHLNVPEDKLLQARTYKQIVDLVIINLKELPENVLQILHKQNDSTIEKSSPCSKANSIMEGIELEYLNCYREMLEDYGEIGPRERKRLEKDRVRLGISEERAQQLEADLSNPSLTEEEQEYLDEYKEMLEDYEEIGVRERKRLEKSRVRLGISEARTKELEGL